MRHDIRNRALIFNHPNKEYRLSFSFAMRLLGWDFPTHVEDVYPDPWEECRIWLELLRSESLSKSRSNYSLVVGLGWRDEEEDAP